MKILSTFENFSKLFPKKINVSYIDADTDRLITRQQATLDELPASFNHPILLPLEGKYWKVTGVFPPDAKTYLRSRQMKLFLQQVTSKTSFNIVPSIAAQMPEILHLSEATVSSLNLLSYQWRQFEFLPAVQADSIQETFYVITSILNNEDNTLQSYSKQYTRENIPKQSLHIPLGEFYQLINEENINTLCFNEDGYVKDGFSIHTEQNTYYGIIKKNYIEELCLYDLECMNEELMYLLATLQLVLVDWSGTNMFSGEELVDDPAKQRPL